MTIKEKITKVAMVLLIVLIAVGFLRGNPNKDIPRLYGKPTISDTYSSLDQCSIDQIVSDGVFLYILYGDHNGNVQVFDLDGGHQYSAYFYTHLNGAFSIAAKDGVLYVRDEHHNIYVLRDGKCESFLTKDEAGSLNDSLDFSVQSREYKVKMGSVWRCVGEEEECIIERSPIAALYQGNMMFILPVCCVMVIGVILGIYKKVNGFM